MMVADCGPPTREEVFLLEPTLAFAEGRQARRGASGF